MNLNQPTAVSAQCSNVPSPMPKDTLSVVLGQSHDAISESIRYADQMIQHVGGGAKDDAGVPSAGPGALGHAMDLRTQIHRLNAKMEQLASLL